VRDETWALGEGSLLDSTLHTALSRVLPLHEDSAAVGAGIDEPGLLN
jgi:hypothetical protein